MRVSDYCADCLYRKQSKRFAQNEACLEILRDMIANRTQEDCSPYLVYRFNKLYEEYIGEVESYTEIKKQYNDLVLSMEDSLRAKIEAADNPLATALMYARIGNYIDFGAMNQVDPDTFLSLFDQATLSEHDLKTLASFMDQTAKAKEFLLLADNCGEVVIDKLFLEQLHKAFPALTIRALVRGGDVLNDATAEDARYVGLDQVASVISNGTAMPGTVYKHITDEARQAIDRADVILSKGQGNYESLSGEGKHVFYAFLCKCDLFTERFKVPRFTGMFVEEQ